MKNVIYRTFFVLISALALIACQGPQGPQGPAGKDGKDGVGVNWAVIPLSVDKWELITSSEGNYYVGSCDVPELTSFVYTSGNVQGYIYLYTEDGSHYQHDLPYVLHMREKDASGNQFDFTRTIDFVYGVGWVEFQLTVSDFVYDPAPAPMDFRIVLTW